MWLPPAKAALGWYVKPVALFTAKLLTSSPSTVNNTLAGSTPVPLSAYCALIPILDAAVVMSFGVVLDMVGASVSTVKAQVTVVPLPAASATKRVMLCAPWPSALAGLKLMPVKPTVACAVTKTPSNFNTTLSVATAILSAYTAEITGCVVLILPWGLVALTVGELLS